MAVGEIPNRPMDRRLEFIRRFGRKFLAGTMRLKPGERDRLSRIPSAHAQASAQ
jgi:hypothetical protein